MILRYFYWLLAIAFVLSFYVWQQTQSVRLGYQVDSRRIECEKWDAENKDLRLKINRLISLERLDAVAQERSLVVPGEKTMVYLP